MIKYQIVIFLIIDIIRTKNRSRRIADIFSLSCYISYNFLSDITFMIRMIFYSSHLYIFLSWNIVNNTRPVKPFFCARSHGSSDAGARRCWPEPVERMWPCTGCEPALVKQRCCQRRGHATGSVPTVTIFSFAQNFGSLNILQSLNKKLLSI